MARHIVTKSDLHESAFDAARIRQATADRVATVADGFRVEQEVKCVASRTVFRVLFFRDESNSSLVCVVRNMAST